MLTIKGVSDCPCFICGSRQKTVEVAFADKTFKGVLCLEHVHSKLMPEVANASHREASSRTA